MTNIGNEQKTKSKIYSSAKHSGLIKKQSNGWNEHEHDAKAYRIIMEQFSSQLNLFNKAQRDCLGEMDEHYRIWLTKEQKIIQNQQLSQIFEKSIDKMKKEMIFRNNAIKNTRTQYLLSYPTQSKQIEQHNQFQLTEMHKQPIGDPSEPNKVHRPNSCVGNRTRSNNFQGIFTNRCWRRQPTKNTLSQSANMDDFQSRDTQPSQCLIFKRQGYRKGSFAYKDNTSRSNQNRRATGISINATTINKFFQQAGLKTKKSIDEQNREKIQTKLTNINTNLAINLVQSQGYRPKAKCWRPNYQNPKQSVL